MKEHVTEEEILNFLAGKYSGIEEKKLKEHIYKCRECYSLYHNLQESAYLIEKGEHMPKSVLNKVFALYEKYKPKSTLSLIISYTKNKLKMLSSDNFKLKPQSLDVAYSMRSNEELVNEKDLIVLEKTVKGYDTALQITRVPATDKFRLWVQVTKNDHPQTDFFVHLYEGSEKIEFIDLSKNNLFDYSLSNQNYTLVFKKQQQELFQVAVKLQNEE